MSLGSVLSSHDRCVKYNASNLIMVLYTSLRREPTQKTTLWRLENCLKSRVGNSRVTRSSNTDRILKIRKM